MYNLFGNVMYNSGGWMWRDDLRHESKWGPLRKNVAGGGGLGRWGCYALSKTLFSASCFVFLGPGR